MELAASRTRLSEAQRVAHIGSWEWSIADNRVSWSDELFNIYGIDRAAFIARATKGSCRAFIPTTSTHTTAVIRQAIESVTPFIYDHRVRRPDGSVRMLYTRGEVLPDVEGRAGRLVGSCWDVTDRWQATQQLEQTVSTLKATLEATADGILVGDRDRAGGGAQSALPGDVAAARRHGRRAPRFASWRTWCATSSWTPTSFVASDGGAVRRRRPGIARHPALQGRPGVRALLDPQRPGRGDLRPRLQLPRRHPARAADASAETRRVEAEAARQRVRDDPGADLRRVRGAGSNLALHVLEHRGRARAGPQRARTDRQAHLDGVCRGARGEVPGRRTSWRWRSSGRCRSASSTRPGADGSRTGSTLAGRDLDLLQRVTEQVESQRELRVTNEQLRALAAAAGRDTRGRAARDRARDPRSDRAGADLAEAGRRLAAEPPHRRGRGGGRRRGARPGDGGPGRPDLETARRVSSMLRPAILDDIGLAAAIAWQARDFQQRTGVPATWTCPRTARRSRRRPGSACSASSRKR